MENKKELFGAMSLAQVELKNPVRNKLGFNYSYSTLDSIIEQTKPILAKYGLVVIQLLSGDGTKVGITTILAHSSGESVQETLWLPSVEMKSTNAVQAMGASISYGRRYSLTSVLGISSEEDTDASTVDKKKDDTTEKSTPPSAARFNPILPPTSAPKVFTTPSPMTGGTGIYPNPNIPATSSPVIHIAPSTPSVSPTQVISAPQQTTAPTFPSPKKPTWNRPNFTAIINQKEAK